MFSLLLLVPICVFPGSAYQSQGLLGNIAWVLTVDVVEGWGLFHIPRRMVFLHLPNLVLSCNWWVPGINTCPSLQDLFHKLSLTLVSGICGRPLTCPYSVGGMVLRISCQFQGVVRLGTWGCFWILFHYPIRCTMGTCTGKYSFINVETIVSAVVSGIQNASGHPVRWSIIVKMYLLPDVDVSHSVMRSIAILSNGLYGISIICKG